MRLGSVFRQIGAQVHSVAPGWSWSGTGVVCYSRIQVGSVHFSNGMTKTLVRAGVFFGHPQGGYGRHLASDGLSFCAKFLSFLGENLVFFMHLVIKTQKNWIKILPCLRSAEFKRIFFSFFGSWVYEKVPKKNPCFNTSHVGLGDFFQKPVWITRHAVPLNQRQSENTDHTNTTPGKRKVASLGLNLHHK